MQQSDPSQARPNCHPCLIEQYKAYLADVGNIGARHAQANTSYVSILSALLVFLSLTGGDNPALGQISNAAQASAGLVAMLLCVAWFAHIKSFGYLYKAKFDVLREMERNLPYPIFKREWELLDPRFSRFTALERSVALLLMVPFAVVVFHSLSNWLA